MTDTEADLRHTFVVPAYGTSPYIGQCLTSLKQQSVGSHILVCSSTPSDALRGICRDQEVELIVNTTSGNIASDWSFAYAQCTTRYITLAHQDDVYHEHYLRDCLNVLRGDALGDAIDDALGDALGDALIVFTDYSEMRDDGVRDLNAILLIKRIILFLAFGFGHSIRSTIVKRRLLSFGSPISCPTVMFNKDRIGAFLFDPRFHVNLDWDAWRRLALKDGAFVFTRTKRVWHRIYENSQTSRGIREGQRRQEDLEMFRQFWPAPLALLLRTIYALSYRSNRS